MSDTYKVKPGVQLMKHQVEAIQFKLKSPIGADFSEVGTGKTASTAIALEYRHVIHKDSERILWITTNTIKFETKKEIEKFTGLVPIVLDGTRADKVKTLKAVKPPYFIIINYETAAILEQELSACKFDSIICDESSHIKNYKAKRSKAIYKIAGALPAKFRWIMTGTPLPNKVIDIFGQWKFVQPALLGRIGQFKDNFCVFKLGPFPILIGYKHLDILKKMLDPRSIRVLRKDCFELPDRVFERRIVEMTEGQEHAYKSLKEEYLLNLQDSEITVKCVLDLITKLSEVTSGFINTPEGEMIELPSAKLNELYNLVEEIDLTNTKAIIWCVFKRTIRKLISDFAEYNPAVSFGEIKDKSAELHKFRTDPTCRLLIAQIATGEGYTVNEATVSIYVEHDYSFKNRDQSLGRNYRKGQTEKVIVYDIACKGTVDMAKLRAYVSKRNVQDEITGDNLRGKLERIIHGQGTG